MPNDLAPDDDLLLQAALPCLRRDGKLYYLGDVQPRVLEACRHYGVSFDMLAEKLGLMRPTLVLILKGYDPVTPTLKTMLDRLVTQAETMLADATAQDESAASPPGMAERTTLASVPVPDAGAAVTMPVTMPVAPVAWVEATAETIPADDVVIPDIVAPAGVATLHVVTPPPPRFTEGLPGVTPGLRGAARSRARQNAARSNGGKPGQFLLT